MDINLGVGQTSLRIADQLYERGTPIVFTSGYNCSEGLVAHLDVPLIEKPFDESVLRHAVFKALEARFKGQAAQPFHTRNTPMSPQSLRNRVRSYWQKQPPAGESPPHPERHRPGRRRRGTPRPISVSEALLLEANLIKRFKPALQRPAQGRQELPVHQGHAGRRLPARRADAQAASTTGAATSGRTRRRRASTSR